MDDDDEESQCTVQYLDGEQETTNWIKRAGKARVIYESGEIYEGMFNKLGEKHGYGEYTFKSHDLVGSYHGQYQQGKKHGKGEMKYPNGDTYSGMWFRNKKQGQGTYTYKNGDVYTGEWKEDRKEGKGTFYNPNTQYQLIGRWKDGKLTKGKWVLGDGTVYNGNFEYNRPTGYGIFTFPNGNQSEGIYEKKRKQQNGEEDDEDEDEDEPEDEDEENPKGPKKYYYPDEVHVSSAPITELNRAEAVANLYIPEFEEVHFLKVETFETYNGREIVTVYNEGLTDANVQSLYVGNFQFKEELILMSGHRIRILSYLASSDPPTEYPDIHNIVWSTEQQWTTESVPELWYYNEDGEKVIIHTYGASSDFEKFQLEEMERLRKEEETRLIREAEARERAKEDAERQLMEEEENEMKELMEEEKRIREEEEEAERKRLEEEARRKRIEDGEEEEEESEDED